jgi:hypothetical protein
LKLHTLELPVKDGLPGSAIPPGRYKVTVYNSPHFGREVPLLEDVPGRSEIEIHYGNYPTDSRGCILVGLEHDLDFVGQTRKAFQQLWETIEEPARAGECWITVQGGLPMRGDSHEEAQDAATAT